MLRSITSFSDDEKSDGVKGDDDAQAVLETG